MNIRRTLPILVAPILLLSAVACGDDDDADTTDGRVVGRGGDHCRLSRRHGHRR